MNAYFVYSINREAPVYKNHVAKFDAAQSRVPHQQKTQMPPQNVGGLLESWIQRSLSASQNSPQPQIGAPNSSAEKEADSIADQIIYQQAPPAQFALSSLSPSPQNIQRKPKPIDMNSSPNLHRGLVNGNVGGQALPKAIAKTMGRKMGTDFSDVRIHVNAQAARMNDALDARAFTYGSEIYFNQGAYDPQSQAGRHLIAHELVHVAQQTRKIQRKPKTTHTAGPTKDLTRSEFEQIMLQTFGVTKIINGTYEDQLIELAVPESWVITRPNWHSFDPGNTSPVYQAIINGFHNFNKAFGGFPQVDQIAFFQVDYKKSKGKLIPDKFSSAKFQNKRMQIFENAFTSGLTLPISRSIPNSTYEDRPAGAIRLGGGVDAAPERLPAKKDILSTIVHHELGHGLKDVAQRQKYNSIPIPDPTMLLDFAREVGWFGDHLYDVGIPSVAAQMAKGEQPAAEYEITTRAWSSSKWNEQPVSLYSVQGGDGEDFAESVRAYIDAPEILRLRSPRRYAFIHGRKQIWAARLAHIKSGPQP